MLKVSKCSKCGSRNAELSNFRPKDFPRSLHLVRCGQCGSVAVTNVYDAVDALRRGDQTEKRLAEKILSIQSAEPA